MRLVCSPLKDAALGSMFIASQGNQVKGVDWACLCKIRLVGGGA